MRNIPYPPIFNSIPANITLAAVGASVWASGNQVWNGNTGSLIANPMMVRKNRTDAGIMRFAAAIYSGSSVISKVLVEK